MSAVFVHENMWEFTLGRTHVSLFGPEGEVIHVENNLISPIPEISEAVIKNYIENVILKERFESEGMLTCEYCDKKKPDVIMRPDPYKYEINEDETEHLMCNECVDDSKENI